MKGIDDNNDLELNQDMDILDQADLDLVDSIDTEDIDFDIMDDNDIPDDIDIPVEPGEPIKSQDETLIDQSESIQIEVTPEDDVDLLIPSNEDYDDQQISESPDIKEDLEDSKDYKPDFIIRGNTDIVVAQTKKIRNHESEEMVSMFDDDDYYTDVEVQFDPDKSIFNTEVEGYSDKELRKRINSEEYNDLAKLSLKDAYNILYNNIMSFIHREVNIPSLFKGLNKKHITRAFELGGDVNVSVVTQSLIRVMALYVIVGAVCELLSFLSISYSAIANNMSLDIVISLFNSVLTVIITIGMTGIIIWLICKQRYIWNSSIIKAMIGLCGLGLLGYGVALISSIVSIIRFASVTSIIGATIQIVNITMILLFLNCFCKAKYMME